jgi:hypothetical protein
MAMLAKCVFSAAWRERYVVGDLIVVHSDTGDEHPDTYAYIEKVLKPFCAAWNIPFFHLTLDLGYHPPSWSGGLRAQYRKNSTVGLMKTRARACTDNLKIVPIYKFLDEYLGRRYDLTWGLKRGLKSYAKRFGKLRVMIGFAKGEERRVKGIVEDPQLALALGDSARDSVPGVLTDKWMVEGVDRFYPLIDEGIDRAGAQAYVAECGLAVPPPSNCMACHFKSPAEIAWTALTLPEFFDDWCALEEAKLSADKTRVDKHGKPVKSDTVKGGETLRQIFERTYNDLQQTIGDHTRILAYLSDYRHSHGHCVTNSM